MDLIGTLVYLVAVLLLGLFVAFNPSLIALNFYIVLKSKQPLRDTLYLVCGVAIPWILVALAAYFWLDAQSTSHLRDHLAGVDIPPLIDTLFGFALISYAGHRAYRARQPKTAKSAFTERASRIIMSPTSIFTFAIARSALGITHLLAIVVVARLALQNNIRPVLAVLGLAMVIVIGLAPLLAAPFFYLKKPEYLNSFQSLPERPFMQRLSGIANILLTALGIWFIVYGVYQFIGGS